MSKCVGTLVLVLSIASSAHASITIGVSPSGSGTLVSTYEGLVTFPQIAYTDNGTITEWTIDGFDAVLKSVGYKEADLDFTGSFNSGFRWAETLTNNSGAPWASFTISLVDTAATFSGVGNFLNTGIGTEEVPGFASIVGSSITVISTLGTPLPITGWEMNLSPDQKTITMDFPTPVAPGQSVQVHIPIVNLGDGDGSFVLSQQAGATPEPTAFIVWTVLLSGALVVGRRERN